MQFWPRVRARYSYARIRNWVASKETKPLGFAGYKVGMTHLLITDNRQHSLTKGTGIFCPVTVVECPPIKTASIQFYKNTINGSKLISQTFAENLDKELARKIITPKKNKDKESVNERAGDLNVSSRSSEHVELSQVTDFDFIRLFCYTQPRLTAIGKKEPDTFEIAIGGIKEQQFAYAKEKLGKEINVSETFKEGQQLDAHSVTKGKGFQGPVKRFGVTLRHHKSEKSRRNPGSLGAWRAQGHIMWRTAHAGKMGYHLRTEYNKWLIKIGSKPEEINVKGGFLNYGIVRNSYVIVKGSLGGPPKRLVRFTESVRQKKNVPEAPQITYTSLESKQGR